jgi:hypothetical protein
MAYKNRYEFTNSTKLNKLGARIEQMGIIPHRKSFVVVIKWAGFRRARYLPETLYLMCITKLLTLVKSCSISRAVVSNMCSPLSNGTVSALEKEEECL